MWSGTATFTESIFDPSFCSSSRQSEYNRAPGATWDAFSRLLASTSHRATICTLLCCKKFCRSFHPIPPTPMQAWLNFPLGEINAGVGVLVHDRKNGADTPAAAILRRN